MERFLSLPEILSAEDLPRETVPVPEWGGNVMIARLTGQEASDMYAALKRSDGSERTFAATVVAFSLCDADGKRLPGNPSIVADQLAAKSYAGLKRVFLRARKLSCLGDDESAEKNSEASRGSCSSSGSPPNSA